MGLTGMGTIYVLITLVVLAMVGTALFWNRAPRPGWLRWATRIALISSCQLTACALAAAVLNDQGQFYNSWGELFGQGAAVTATSNYVEHTRHDLADAITTAQRRGTSTIVHLPVPVAGSDRVVTALVYLPAAYFTPTGARLAFPVIELLDGFPGTPYSWTHALDVRRVADRAIESGQAAPFVAVLPTQNYLGAGHDAECLDIPHRPPVETTLVTKVQQTVADTFRVLQPGAGWAVMGYSTGGYCALNIAMRHPDRYGVAGSLAGYTSPYEDHTTGSIFRDNPPSVRQDNDPNWRITHLPPPSISVFFAASKGDRPSWRQVSAFLPRVRAPMQVASFVVDHGGHNFATIGAFLPPALHWVSGRLAPARASAAA